MSEPDRVFLYVNDIAYSGWTDISITRGIDRCVSSFHFSATERPDGPYVRPFDLCEIYVEDDKYLTGYVESVTPHFDKGAHSIRISGHSRTKDLTDCNPDIQSGQFSGFTFAQIARAICGLFKIDVVIETDNANQVVQNTNLERSESGFKFLERLANLSGVLLTDDEEGRLVLTVAGDTRSPSRLVQGDNILSGNAAYNVEKRFSNYIIKGQSGIGCGAAFNLDGDGGVSEEPPVGEIQTAMRAEAIDPDVPRYRPHVTLAESQLTPAQMQERVNWQRQYAYGQSIKISVRTPNFRQSDGKLWRPNILVPLDAPWFFADDAELLVAQVTLTLDANSSGHVADLMLGPIEGYMPDPGKVKVKKAKHSGGGGGKKKSGGGGMDLSGIGGIP